MRYFVHDNDDDNGNRVFDTLEECSEYMQEQARWNGCSLEEATSGMEIYEVGPSVPVNIRPETITFGTSANIPAPLPSETVSDYARRISGG